MAGSQKKPVEDETSKDPYRREPGPPKKKEESYEYYEDVEMLVGYYNSYYGKYTPDEPKPETREKLSKGKRSEKNSSKPDKAKQIDEGSGKPSGGSEKKEKP